MSIGENIRCLRKKAGLTQKQLANIVGVNEVTIRSYEAGKYEPKTETLYKLVTALKCNIHEILDKPFDLTDCIFIDIDIDNLDELPKKIEELKETTARARLLNISNPSNPPRFTISTHNEGSPKGELDPTVFNSDIADEQHFTSIIKKMSKGQALTDKEAEFHRNFLEKKLRNIGDIFAKYYFLLNEEGQKKADEQISRTLEFLELISKVPEYQKKQT